MNPNYKIPESVLVVIYTAELEVLLIERADRPGYWQSVTGSKQTADEQLMETAVREVREETGIIVAAAQTNEVAGNHEMRVEATLPPVNLRDWQLMNIFDIYPVWRHRYAPGVTQNTEHVFGLCVPRDIPVRLAPREHLDYLWLPYRQAADKCFSPSNAQAILQLPRRIE
jgi:dATP pyrophosphohydrolase